MPFPWVFPMLFDAPPDTMHVVLQEDRPSIIKGSISVDTRIEERSTASFVIEDKEGILTYRRGEPVEIFDTEENRIFSGFISTPEQKRMAPDGGLYHPIQCTDNHYLADKRRVALSYTGQTCGFMVADIHAQYLVLEGVGIGSIEAGPVVIEAVFNYVRASDALDALAVKAGKIWYIDENKQLWFVDRDVTPAPFNITDDDLNKIKGSTRLSGGNPMYRNRQYIRGGRDVTGVQVETFTGDGVRESFTVGYPINSVPTVTVNVVVQTVGIKGIDEAFNCYWSKGDPVIVFDAGSIPGAVAVVITYVGQYDILALATNEVEINAQKAIEGDTTTGFVDDIADEPKLDDHEAAFDSAQSLLAKYGVNAARYNYSTLTLGLRPGQIQTITDSAYGLVAEEMLIESVRFNGMGRELLHDIVAIQGPDMGSWAQYFKRLASQKDEVMEKLNVGSDQILIILVLEKDIWEWAELVTTTPFACTVVDGVLCGGVLPLVC